MPCHIKIGHRRMEITSRSRQILSRKFQNSQIKKASLFLKRKRIGREETAEYSIGMTDWNGALSADTGKTKVMDLTVHSPRELSLSQGAREHPGYISSSLPSKSAQKILQLTGLDTSYDSTGSWIARRDYAESIASSISSESVYSQEQGDLGTGSLPAAHQMPDAVPCVRGEDYIALSQSCYPSLKRVSAPEERMQSLFSQDFDPPLTMTSEIEERVWVDARKSGVVDDRIAQEMARYKECFLPNIWEEGGMINPMRKAIAYPPDPHPGELYPCPLVIQKPLFGIKSSHHLTDASSETQNSPLESARESVVSQIRHLSTLLRPKSSEIQSHRGSRASSASEPNGLELVLPLPPPGKSCKDAGDRVSPSRSLFNFARIQRKNTQARLVNGGVARLSRADAPVQSPPLVPEGGILVNAARRINGPATPMPTRQRFPSALPQFSDIGSLYYKDKEIPRNEEIYKWKKERQMRSNFELGACEHRARDESLGKPQLHGSCPRREESIIDTSDRRYGRSGLAMKPGMRGSSQLCQLGGEKGMVYYPMHPVRVEKKALFDASFGACCVIANNIKLQELFVCICVCWSSDVKRCEPGEVGCSPQNRSPADGALAGAVRCGAVLCCNVTRR